ncbi:hypothetical protein [Rhizobium leguminosarum]|uniref:hypothetical protein n=1 Tax=Rhizobium leguminosarum TaxID=384 RepID=UPI00035FB94B|nr:hypothetical protein [Rhizobium leguminosarum]
MALHADDLWQMLLQSVAKRRSYEARFYKPGCLFVVANLIKEGALDPEDLKIEPILRRFNDLVSSDFPDRASLGWRPFWHLSNDGAWVFSKDQSRVTPNNFGVARKPDSLGQLIARFDKIAIPGPMLDYWTSTEHRARLQIRLLEMFDGDDQDCRKIAARLRLAIFDPTPSYRLDALLGHSGQGFEADPSGVRR